MPALRRFALKYPVVVVLLLLGLGAASTLLLWTQVEGYPLGLRLLIAVGLSTVAIDQIGMAYLDWVRRERG